jgi:hypothetical protein
VKFFLHRLIVAIALLWPLSSVATQRSDTLYINRGQFVTVKKTTFPALAFNRTPQYEQQNARIVLHLQDTLHLVVINHDSVEHLLNLPWNGGLSNSISPNASLASEYVASEPGCLPFHDPSSYRYMGLAGLIAVLPDDSKSFFWNMREYETSFSNEIAAGRAVDPSKYDPDYFTINGKSYPEIEQDTSAKIRAKVGEKVYVFIANTGQSTHAIHFHGFHCMVVASTNDKLRIGWSKDSFPIKSMTGVLLQFIPDKPGKYSVHDHNLVAVSAGGTHPNGMFTIMEVQ